VAQLITQNNNPLTSDRLERLSSPAVLVWLLAAIQAARIPQRGCNQCGIRGRPRRRANSTVSTKGIFGEPWYTRLKRVGVPLLERLISAVSPRLCEFGGVSGQAAALWVEYFSWCWTWSYLPASQCVSRADPEISTEL